MKTVLHRVRLRVFAVLLAIGLAALGVLGWTTLPALPVVGVAVVAAVAVVNTMASKLAVGVCAGCGGSIEGQPSGTYGITCETCGTINGGPNALDTPRKA
ncbi:MAG: hypothetical protein AAF995_01165 [Planctomycetota bacterium]